MSKLALALGLFLAASIVYAGCMTNTDMQTGRICTFCCDGSGNCFTTCSGYSLGEADTIQLKYSRTND